MDGILPFLKPPGITSHDAVAICRRILKEKRIGHSGTLDPMAYGVLPVFLGKATRLIEYTEDFDKTYVAECKLGTFTDTEDSSGQTVLPDTNMVLRDGVVLNMRNAGMTNAKPAILLMIRKLPEANIIQTVDSIRAKLPELQETIPAAIDLQIAQDRSPTIRASLEEVEQTLIISVALVILVVFLFLRSGRATIIPAVSVPVSLIGTFAAMYLCGFSLNNLSPEEN